MASEYINSFVQYHFKLAMPDKIRNLTMTTKKAYVGDKIPILETKIEHL